jgi:hypothetical protein
MATALRDQTFEAFAAIAADIDPFQNDHQPIPVGYEGPVPDWVIVRDVGMVAGGGLLDFFYTTPRPRGPLPPGGIQEVIDDLIEGEAAAGAALAAGEGVSAAAGETENPLDLNIDRPAFVVFRLSPSWRWGFDRNQPGVTTKVAAHAQPHGALRHVGMDGVPHDVPGPGRRIVYFIANPPAGVYFQGFNLEVELEQSDGPLGLTRIMPISIDPDIRNPGGSQS